PKPGLLRAVLFTLLFVLLPAGMPKHAHLASLVVRLVPLGIVIWWAARDVGKDWPRRLAVRRASVTHLLLALTLCLPWLCFNRGIRTIAEQVLPSLPVETLWERQAERVRGAPLWFALVFIAVMPAAIEEVFFRGFIGRGLVGRYGILKGVLLT